MEDEKKDFIKEHIKKKPVDKKLYVVRTGLVVLLGVLFGLVAAVSYTAGVYHLERNVYREPVKEVVLGNKESEDAYGDAGQVQLDTHEDSDSTSNDTQAGSSDKENTASDTGALGTEKEGEDSATGLTGTPADKALADFEAAYSSLYAVAREAAGSLLPVYAVKSDQGWFTKVEEFSSQGSGLVIADNRRELLILIDRSVIADSDRIKVMMPDGSSAEAVEKKHDPNINLSIIGVELDAINDEAKALIKPAVLGTSTGDRLLGKNVIAVGSPLGISESLSYGIVTSCSRLLQKPDTDVHLITTDIYGSTSGSGILVNLRGQTVGIITQDGVEPGVKNLVNAYGISDIKDSIQRMANGQDKAYFGILGSDVTSEAIASLNIPQGAYVTGVEIDSKAMECGIKSGDVITMVGTNEVKNFSDYKIAINNAHPGDETVISIKRSSMGGYAEMTFEVTFGTLK